MNVVVNATPLIALSLIGQLALSPRWQHWFRAEVGKQPRPDGSAE
jgi:hypothetical protein